MASLEQRLWSWWGERKTAAAAAPVLRSRDIFALAMGNLTRFKSGM
jgi:hypothetical protein